MGLAGESVRLRQSQVQSTDRVRHVDRYTVVAHVNAAIAAGLIEVAYADRYGRSHPQHEQPAASPRCYKGSVEIRYDLA
jgi:hypothetical protein